MPTSSKTLSDHPTIETPQPIIAPSVASDTHVDVPRSGLEPQALALVKGYLGWTAGAGLVPVPGADMVLITGIQLRMLSKLSKLYGVPFKKDAAKSIVAALVGSAVPTGLASGISSSLKAAPGVGTLLGIVTLPALASASTYAIGRVFITHFEAGGTFLDFKPEKVREYFASEFNKAKTKQEITTTTVTTTPNTIVTP